MVDIVLFGIQGSGKGTQATMLQQSIPDVFSYFSSGDIFRALRSAPNAIGEYLGNRLDTGSLINDKVTEAMFTMYVHTVLDDNKYMLLDGFPRNIKQLQELTSAAKEHGRTLHGIWFTLDRETATTRMLRRGRADDTTSSIGSRLQQFYDKTIPMIELCQTHFPITQIDANDTIENIHAQVMKVVG